MPSGHDHDHAHAGHAHHGHHHDDVGGAPLAPEDMHDPAQESLVRALQSSFNVLRWLMIGLIVAYVCSGVFQVQTGEQGLIVRFGVLQQNTDAGSTFKDTPIFEPGWHIALPDPFDEKIRISGKQQTVHIYTFLFDRLPEDRSKPLSEAMASAQLLKPGVDGAMLTGDRNLSHGDWMVQYLVMDGAKFVANVTDSPEQFETLLRRITERAIVRAAASRRVEDIIGGAVAIAAEVKAKVQAELDALDAGVKIDNVSARTIEPLQVREAFTMVSAAENQRQTQIEEAEKQATERLTKTSGPGYRTLIDLIKRYGAAQARNAPAAEQDEFLKQIDVALDEATEAGGEVATLLRGAQGRASQIREKIRSELEEFHYHLDLYRTEPQVAMLRIWVQMRESVLGAVENELMFLPNAGEMEIVINRDPERKAKADALKYQKGTRGQGP